MKYIYQHKAWPSFTWNQQSLALLLASAHQRLGLLIGQMNALGFKLQNEAMLQTLTLDVVKNSEIESEVLDPDQVRSSIARQLGMNVGGLIPSDRYIDGVVEMMLDATQHFNQPLTKNRLFDWHAALFPTGRSGMHQITTANWRSDKNGAMQVISDPIGRERIHFEAPPAKQINAEMKSFISWFNTQQMLDPLLKAGIAHLWFVTIHPFEDGNGRIARAITDMQLARNDMRPQRFYSMSAQIRLERSDYYHALEKTQKNGLDITDWLHWFLTCLTHSLTLTESNLKKVLDKAAFWKKHEKATLNKRQQLLLSKLLDGFDGKLTSSKWMKIAKCSQDTALRDIQDLIAQKILIKEEAGGRSTSYILK